MLPVLLKPVEKCALDLISDWPWIALKDLAGLLDVSPQRASKIVIPLEGFGLAARPRDAGGRLALTDRGLALLARGDRTSVAVARRRRSIAPEDPEGPLEWRNVTGRRTRQLLRNMEHTAAVHDFLAALTAQARLLGWEVVQLDPPRRASRHFRHDGGMRAVNPDAFGVLRKGDTCWPFFLEWERRAVRPSTMSARLAPYLRYYSSHRPTDDHGTRPSVLVVFDDEIAHTHFLRVAREEMKEAGGAVPLWVSHREAVDALGPLGRAWRISGDPESPQGPCRPNERRVTRETHAYTRRPEAERPPEAQRTDRCPAQHGGPLEATRPAEPLPELARQGDRGQPRLRVDAGQRGAGALRSHPPPDAQGPGTDRIPRPVQIGGER